MSKVSSWDDLKQMREKIQKDTPADQTVLAVGMATCGVAAGARDTMAALQKEIEARGLRNIALVGTGCYGYCYAEPMVEVRVPGRKPVRYGNVTPEAARKIVDQHLEAGNIVQQYVIQEGEVRQV